MTRCPLFVELCAGTAAVSLRLQGGPSARPPVSRMGSKRGYSEAILWALGLRSGEGADAYLWCEPDDGARLMLQAYPQPDLLRAAAEIIRGWSGEEPRALWERLRKEGPIGSGAYEVARWSFINARRRPGDGGYAAESYEAEGRTGWPGNGPPRPELGRRLEALAIASHVTANGLSWKGNPDAGFKATGGGDVDQGPPHVSLMEERVASLATGWPPVTVCADAREVEPSDLPPGTVAYIDPNYQGTTGYADGLTREEVLDLGRMWDAAGAIVCISEAEPLEALGWHHVEITSCRSGQKRTFSKQQREWLTMNREPAWTPATQTTLFEVAQ